MQRYGGTSGRGRRIIGADTPLSDPAIKTDEIGKARYYDPEHRRQRRLGAAEAGLLAAGGLAIGHGTQGAVKSTRALRALKIRSGGKTPSDIPVSRTKVGRLSAAASPRELGYIGGGTAAVTAAGEVHRQSGNKGRLRAWK
jgi:hypothetical protein